MGGEVLPRVKTKAAQMLYPFVGTLVFHATILFIDAICFCYQVLLESFYTVIAYVILNVSLPISDALWSTGSQLVKLFCRSFLVPHSLYVAYRLPLRRAQAAQARIKFYKASEACRSAECELFARENYCVKELLRFMWNQVFLMRCAVACKFRDGKLSYERQLYHLVQKRYHMPMNYVQLSNGPTQKLSHK